MADQNTPNKDPKIAGQELAAINSALPGSIELPGKASQVIEDLAEQTHNINLSGRKRSDYRSVLKTVVAAHPEAADVAVQDLSPQGKYGKDHSPGFYKDDIKAINEVKEEIKQSAKPLKGPSF